jgi:hypothetical protein
MQSRLRMIALTVTCRHCKAGYGLACFKRRYTLHLVRYNDARRILNDRYKLKEWEQLYGKGSAA